MEATLNRFEVRSTTQREWGILALIAMFFGGVGSGFFLVSQFFSFTIGVVAALIIVLVGMGGAYTADLGNPQRSWRMLTSWSALKTAWIARGIWGMVLFLIFGALYIAPSLGWFAWLPWTSEGIVGRVLLGIAIVLGFFEILYIGFEMSSSPAIAFWNTAMLPVLFLVYGLISGIGLVFISVAVLWQTYAIDIRLLELVQIGLLIACGIFLWAYLAVKSSSKIGAKEAVRMITKGGLSPMFWGIVIVIGLIIPLAILLYSYLSGGVPLAVTGVVGLLVLIGYLFFRHIVLRTGVYSPLI